MIQNLSTRCNITYYIKDVKKIVTINSNFYHIFKGAESWQLLLYNLFDGGDFMKNGKTLSVGKENCDFKNIQDAIDSAKDGDTILVKAGAYKGSLTISKAVRLVGCTESIMEKSSKELPVVQLANGKTEFESCKIESDNVQIEGIVFSNCSGHEFKFQKLGDFVKKSDFWQADYLDISNYLIYVNGNVNFKNIGIVNSKKTGSNGIAFCGGLSEISDSLVFRCNVGIRIESKLAENPKISGLNAVRCFVGLESDGKSNPVVLDSSFKSKYYGIWTKGKSEGIFRNCKISSSNTGIAVSGYSSPIIDSCEISQNHVGIGCVDFSSPTIKNCRISKSYSTVGFSMDGITVDSTFWDEIIDVYDFDYEKERAEITGSGIFSSSENLKIQNCVLESNFDGLKIDGRHLRSLLVENCDFSGNEDGIWLNSAKNCKIGENLIKNCRLYKNGCGIVIKNSSEQKIESCQIYENESGLRFFKSEEIEIVGCLIFSNNEKNWWHPGINVEDSDASLSNCEIKNHIGCGIRIENNGKISFSKCNFSENRTDLEKISEKGERKAIKAESDDESKIIKISAPKVDEKFDRNFDIDDEFENQKREKEEAEIAKKEKKSREMAEKEKLKRIEYENSDEYKKLLAEQEKRKNEQKQIKEREAALKTQTKNLQTETFTKENAEKDFITIFDGTATVGISKNLVSAKNFKIFNGQKFEEDDSQKNALTLKSFANEFCEFLRKTSGGNYRLPTFAELKLLFEKDNSLFSKNSCELTDGNSCVFIDDDGKLQTKVRDINSEYNFRICRTISVKKSEKSESKIAREELAKTENLLYETDKQNDGYVFKGCKDQNTKNLVIPEEIEGKKIVHIAKDAFGDLKNLETLKFDFDASIIKNSSSFGLENCYQLKQIQFGSKITIKLGRRISFKFK